MGATESETESTTDHRHNPAPAAAWSASAAHRPSAPPWRIFVRRDRNRRRSVTHQSEVLTTAGGGPSGRAQPPDTRAISGHGRGARIPQTRAACAVSPHQSRRVAGLEGSPLDLGPRSVTALTQNPRRGRSADAGRREWPAPRPRSPVRALMCPSFGSRGLFASRAVESAAQEPASGRYQSDRDELATHRRQPLLPRVPRSRQESDGRWDSDRRVWTFPPRYRANVIEILDELFGYRESATDTVVVRLTVGDTAVHAECDSVRAAGRVVARASGRDSAAKLGAGVAPDEGERRLRLEAELAHCRRRTQRVTHRT